jgi:lantibiotic modifying enzyme
MLLLKLFVEKFFDNKMTIYEMCSIIYDYGVDKFFADLAKITGSEEYNEISNAYYRAKKHDDMY